MGCKSHHFTTNLNDKSVETVYTQLEFIRLDKRKNPRDQRQHVSAKKAVTVHFNWNLQNLFLYPYRDHSNSGGKKSSLDQIRLRDTGTHNVSTFAQLGCILFQEKITSFSKWKDNDMLNYFGTAERLSAKKNE